MLKSRFALLGLLVLTITPAHSDYTIEGFAVIQDENPEAAKLHLKGIGHGLKAANAALDIRGAEKLFCVPSDFSLRGQNFVDIYNQEIEQYLDTDAYTPKYPISLPLLNGLQSQFPCDN